VPAPPSDRTIWEYIDALNSGLNDARERIIALERRIEALERGGPTGAAG
jgi:hypothetical protein